MSLPLLPLKLADPFWQLGFTGVLCSNGFLALLAVVLVNLAAALLPESRRHDARRLLVRRCCGWVAIGFLLLIPLQGLAAWRGLENATALSNRAGQGQQARIQQFRQAVISAQSLAGLQANLAAIQAPPLSAADQRLGLPAIKADLLAQLKAQERPSGAPSGPPVPRAALIKDSLRVLLLSLALAMGFAVGARRRSLAEVGPAEPVGVAGAVVPG
ncbi:MAG: hypothetical protein WCQ20_01690 [Synechococcaceae cyanobacterium ELA739]